jgi:hypothetical protein
LTAFIVEYRTLEYIVTFLNAMKCIEKYGIRQLDNNDDLEMGSTDKGVFFHLHSFIIQNPQKINIIFLNYGYCTVSVLLHTVIF